MVVENTSVLSKEDAFEALYITAKHNLFFKYMYAALLLFVGIAILVYGLIANLVSWISMGSIFAALGVAYAIYAFICIKNSPKDIRKKNADICEYGITYNYRFREQGLDITAVINGKRSKLTFSYEEFKVVYDRGDRFEIRLKTNEVMYVLKSGFKTERMIEFFIKNISTNKKLNIVDKKKDGSK